MDASSSSGVVYDGGGGIIRVSKKASSGARTKSRWPESRPSLLSSGDAGCDAVVVLTVVVVAVVVMVVELEVVVTAAPAAADKGDRG